MKDHADDTEAEIVVEAETAEDVTEIEEPVTEEADADQTDDDALETTAEPVTEDDDPEADEIVVSFGDEDEKPEAESSVIKAVRQTARDEKRKRKELEKKIEELTAQKPVELGPEPDIADYDFDVKKYDAARDAYNGRKAEIAQRAQAEKAKQEAVQVEFNAKKDAYNSRKSVSEYKDFPEAEGVAASIIGNTIAGAIIANVEDPVKFIYALGTYPDKADELAKMGTENAFALGRKVGLMESKMTVTSKRSKPAPEKRMKSGAAVSVSGEKKLEQLREAAEVSGDYSEVTAYKRKLRSSK